MATVWILEAFADPHCISKICGSANSYWPLPIMQQLHPRVRGNTTAAGFKDGSLGLAFLVYTSARKKKSIHKYARKLLPGLLRNDQGPEKIPKADYSTHTHSSKSPSTTWVAYLLQPSSLSLRPSSPQRQTYLA